jgi:hypothetical protein
MREKDAEIARHGLTAIAMIDQQRVDIRDIPMCLSLLYHAANRVGADAGKLEAISEPSAVNIRIESREDPES